MKIADRVNNFIKMLLENIHRRRRVVLALSCIVVFITTYVLILPAFTLDEDEAASQGGIDIPQTVQVEEVTDDPVAEGNTPVETPSDSQTQKTEDAEVLPDDSAKETGKGEPATQGDPASGGASDVVAEDEVEIVEAADAENVPEDDSILDTKVLTADGRTFSVRVTYGADAEIPDGAYLNVSELSKRSSAYKDYQAQAEEILSEDANIEEMRVFDISIYESTGPLSRAKIEPKAPVDVRITYDEAVEIGEDNSLAVVHFADEGPEILAADTDSNAGAVSTVDFTTESFSAFAVIEERITPAMADGCIAYFSFDDMNAGFTGQGATATRVGNPVLKAGHSGTSVYLDGTNYMNVTGGSNGHLLTGLDEFTISYWASTKEATSDGTHGNWAYYAAPNGNAQGYSWEHYIGVNQQNNGITAERYDNNGVRPQNSIHDDNATVMHEWHHIVVIYRTGSTTLYVDGQEIGTSTQSVADLTDMLGNDSIFQIGRANWGTGEGYRGYLDEFAVFNYPLSESEIKLLNENAYYHEADKLSVTQLQDGENYIIYNEVWNPDAGLTGAYEYYAIDGNGNLVKVYDKSDLIYYRSDTSLEWKLTVYTNESGETGYYEFYNEETGKYLAPQAAQLLQNDVIGLHLNGRQDGTYASVIEAWDDGAMSYYGYKYEKQGNTLVLNTASESAAEDDRDWEFFFAHPIYEKSVDVLETVDTVDNPNGLRIQMFDYPSGGNYTAGNSSYSNYQNEIMSGIRNSTSGNQWSAEHVTQGLVSPTLVDGFPVSTTTNSSLSPLFTNGKTVDNLFIQAIYDESGYYEYSSFDNYAYLGNGNEFTVYKQLGAPSAPSNQETNPEKYYQRGNFFPYNTISADEPEPYDAQKNYITEFLTGLSPDDPRYGETIYRAQGTLNYHFGMNISADFVMTNGGNDNRGNPITFEFNGDDDMWVYVDGVLLLDMGGTHNAHSGSINFETGEIVVKNIRNPDYYRTTIVEQYRKAHVYPDGTPWPDGDDSLIDNYFVKDSTGKYTTYVDYTAHQLQMYYMERGGGASNLHVKFNLPIAEPGTLKISKEIGDADPRYSTQTFSYQICDENGNPVTHIGGEYDDISRLYNEATGQNISIDQNGIFTLRPGETAVASIRDEHMHYSIKELGISPDDYDVDINGNPVTITNGEASSDVDTVHHRPVVVINNKPKHLGALRITKIIEADVKDDPSPRFEFYVYLENQNGEIVPYSQGEYYVMKGDRYCEYRNGELIELPEGEKPNPLRAGQFGAINNIPDGYSIFVPNLIPGTHFLVTERLDRIPEGYMFDRKELTAGTYDETTTSAKYNGTSPDGKIKSETTADEIVFNRPTGVIEAEKIWNSGAFVTTHGDIYAALYKRTGSGDSATYELVEGSVRKVEYDSTSQKYKVVYYLPSNKVSDYVVREVSVTVNSDQSITVNNMIADGGSIIVTGETTQGYNGQGSGTDASDGYTVTYSEGDQTTYTLPAGATSSDTATGTTRTDQITNTLPKVSLYKVNEVSGDGVGKKYLKNAVFTLENQAGETIRDSSGNPITFTSDDDGMLFVNRYFSEGVYYLHETGAPTGYALLENRIVITATNGYISAALESPGTTIYENQLDDSSTEYRFEVNNTPDGIELPHTGGTGTTFIYILGIILIVFGYVGLAISRKRKTA